MDSFEILVANYFFVSVSRDSKPPGGFKQNLKSLTVNHRGGELKIGTVPAFFEF